MVRWGGSGLRLDRPFERVKNPVTWEQLYLCQSRQNTVIGVLPAQNAASPDLCRCSCPRAQCAVLEFGVCIEVQSYQRTLNPEDTGHSLWHVPRTLVRETVASRQSDWQCRRLECGRHHRNRLGCSRGSWSDVWHWCPQVNRNDALEHIHDQ